MARTRDTRETKSLLESAALGLIDQSHDVTEAVRLRVLKALNILDTPPEIVYNDVVAVAKKVCGTTSATLTFIGEHYTFIKASTRPAWGETGAKIPRGDTFCNTTIQTPNEMMIVFDARRDNRFANNPYVLNHSVCFYAGVPLVTEQGVALGTLCVVDQHPRVLSEDEMAALKSLTRIVTALAMTHAVRSTAEQEANLISSE